MSGFGGLGESCFDLSRPIVGRSPGRVCLSAFREMRVEHRFLVAPLTLSLERVAAVRRPQDLGELPVLVREPKVLPLLSEGAFTPPNIAIVLRAPMHTGPLRSNAQVVVRSRRERKQGLEVDILLLSVVDADSLIAASRAAGVVGEGTLGELLATSILPAPPEMVEQILEARRKSARRVALTAVLVASALTLITAARLVATSMPSGTVLRVALSALSGAWLSGLVQSTQPARAEPISRRWIAFAMLATTATIITLAIYGATRRTTGAALIVSWALMGAAAAGPLLAPGLRGLRVTRRASPQPDSGAPPYQRRWALGSAAALIAIATIVISTVAEEQAARLVRTIESALVDAEDLPARWEPCCGPDDILRGGDLDAHICGSDDAALPVHVAAIERSFNKPTVANDAFVDAHLDLTILLAPTVEDARAEFASVDSPSYFSCASASAGRLARYWQSRATGEPEVEVRPRQSLANAPGAILDTYRVRVPVGDAFDVTWVHFVRMRIGRGIIRLPILGQSPEGLDPDEIDTIVDAVVDEITSADPEWASADI